MVSELRVEWYAVVAAMVASGSKPQRIVAGGAFGVVDVESAVMNVDAAFAAVGAFPVHV